MRVCLLFVLLLNAFVFAQSCDIKPLPAFLDSPEKQALAKVRDSLLASLQAQDSSEVFRYVSVLKNSGYGERALDNYELLRGICSLCGGVGRSLSGVLLLFPRK